MSERFSQTLRGLLWRSGGRVAHPRYRRIVTSGAAICWRVNTVPPPAGLPCAFLGNAMHRAMGAWERVVFSSPDPAQPTGTCAALPFGTHDFRTRQVLLTQANFMPALQASCSVPFVLQAVQHIRGATRAYWDGGTPTDHLHLSTDVCWMLLKMELMALPVGATAQKPFNRLAWCSTRIFSRRWCPDGSTKSLKWRHKATSALDSVVLLAPDPDWVRSTPRQIARPAGFHALRQRHRSASAGLAGSHRGEQAACR